MSHTCSPGQCLVTDNRTTVSLEIFSFLGTKYFSRWSHLYSSYYSQSFWVMQKLNISAATTKKMQTRERKLRPKPEGIKIKLEPVIFGSLTWGPWIIGASPQMDGWVLGSS